MPVRSTVARNQALKRKANKAILSYVKAVERVYRECAQEFTQPLTSHMTYLYSEMLRARNGVYRKPPQRHVRLVRAEADGLIHIFDLPLLYITCECFLPGEDAVWLFLAVVWSRAQVMRNVKKEYADSLALGDEVDEHIMDQDDPRVLMRACHLFWEQITSETGEDGNAVDPWRIPFIRARAAGRAVALRNERKEA